ncbi:MAG TPA: hypothetical protein VFW71_11740, partial [Actinomycetota bacterium]|nr:hypothetical protein [Actinomycetota bacterium]
IGNAVVPFYGADAGGALTALLKDHIMIAVGIVAASIEDDEEAATTELKRWDDNAAEIAALLSGANPNWPEDAVNDLLAQHLSLTKNELLARLNGEWDDDIAAFDDIFTEILTVASVLADGLVAQFPERFSPDSNAASLEAAMRRLWADHVIWTRQYIVSAVAGRPDADAAAGRLLRNQEDIGNAAAGFYGDEAGAALTGLLKDHIMIAVDLVAAAKAGDTRAFKRHDRRWDANADEIAAFLAGANPNWPEDAVRDLLGQHLALTKGEAVARLEENWANDVTAFDDILTEIVTMADALSAGLVAQFPEKFDGSAAEAGAPAANGTASDGAKLHFASSFGER